MSVPVFDVNTAVINNLPPNKRKPKWILFMQALAYPLVRLQSLFRGFISGSIDTGYWNSVVTYSQGDKVRDITGVYESLTDGNLNNPIGNTTFWLKVLDSFIGASERVKYNDKYLNLTYELNRQFNTLFIQPPYPDDPYTPGAAFSEIYLTTDTPTVLSFAMYRNPAPSNIMWKGSISGYAMFTNTLTGTVSSFSYTIHIPLYIYNALGATNPIRESVVRNFIDGLNCAGLTYRVLAY